MLLFSFKSSSLMPGSHAGCSAGDGVDGAVLWADMQLCVQKGLAGSGE